MTYIDRNKVCALFLRLSGISPDRGEEFSEIIEDACYYVASRLKENILVSSLARVEFASAAVAIYDNTVLKLVNDRTLCTYDGKSVVNYKDTDSYKYAAIMRDNALAAIADLCESDTFAFAAVEG